ncbi:hypothetical protein MMC22_003326 [Lobaria immixta]|nr:hypothetical protein [Lobaria immixta]
MAGGKVIARNLSILQSGKYSDMTISCEDVVFHVHRAVLCPASEFFTSACDGDFEEAHTRVISLEGQVDVVKMMLLYLYTGDYFDPVTSFQDYWMGGPEAGVANNEDNADAAAEKTSIWMTNNVRVYAIADKYVLPGLKKLAKTKFRNIASSTALILRFPAVICEIYYTTPQEDRGLRDIVTNICCPSVQEIVYRNDWGDAVRTHVDFVFDLLRAFAEISKKKDDNVVSKQQIKKKTLPSF